MNPPKELTGTIKIECAMCNTGVYKLWRAFRKQNPFLWHQGKKQHTGGQATAGPCRVNPSQQGWCVAGQGWYKLCETNMLEDGSQKTCGPR